MKIFPPGAGAKKLCVCAHFRITVNIFEAFRQARKQHQEVKFLDWCPYKIWHNLLFSQNSLHPNLCTAWHGPH